MVGADGQALAGERVEYSENLIAWATEKGLPVWRVCQRAITLKASVQTAMVTQGMEISPCEVPQFQKAAGRIFEHLDCSGRLPFKKERNPKHL
jgi:hypothetical protein